MRGAKTIARFFPHSEDLEPAIKTLRRFMPKRDGTTAKYEVAGFWDRYRPETRETLTKEVASESFLKRVGRRERRAVLDFCISFDAIQYGDVC